MTRRRATRGAWGITAALIGVALGCAVDDEPSACDETPRIVAEGWPRVAVISYPFVADERPPATYVMTRGHLGYECQPDTAEGDRVCPLDLSGLRWDEGRDAFTRRRADGGASAAEPFAGDVLWEAPVHAPISGRVIACWRGMPDDDDDGDDVNCPGGERLCSASGNHLTILGDDGLVVTLCHLRAESIPFALCPIDERYLYANAPRRCGLDGPWEGYRDPTRLDLRGVDAPLVRAGDFVGQVGTSGSGKGVHLHLQAKPHAFDGDNHCEGPSLPIAFADARYGRACEGVDPALARWIDLDGRVLPIDGHTLLLAGEE